MVHPDGVGASGGGLLVPDVRIIRVNGVELSFPYYLSLSQSHDLTVTPHVYTEVLPALEVEYRRMTSMGPFEIGGIGTYGSRVPASELPLPGASERDLLGSEIGRASGRERVCQYV